MHWEEFERLNPEEQERVLHQIPFKERGELLLHAHDPDRLTQSLSQEELYLVTREMDLEERSEIIRYANLPQLFFISDIDLWKKDRLNPEAFLRWLETLQEADEARLLAWLAEMDYEMVVSGFEQLIQVLKPETEYPSDELLGDQPFFTLDERYFILVKEENLETIRRAIEILFENHRGRYAAILEGVMGELDYEMEEGAFQKRGIRLADRGFPDPETAHHIYRPLTQEEFERFPRKQYAKREAGNGSPFQWKVPHYLVLRSPDPFFLDEALLLFRGDSEDVREGLEEEMAWLSNKVIASEGIDFASEERVRLGIDRARNLVNIGLEVLTGRDLVQARSLMSERWLEIIFRWGVTQLLELRSRALKIAEAYRPGSRRLFLEFLTAPYGPIFRGLFQPLPKCFDPEVKDHPDHLRDFRDIKDLERARRAVLQIERIYEFLARSLGSVEFYEDLNLFSLLGTVFAHFVTRGKVSGSPLSESAAFKFVKKSFEEHPSGRLLGPGPKEKFLNRFFSGPDQDLLKPLWGLVFQRLDEELGALDLTEGIDRRFVSSLCLKAALHEKDWSRNE